MTKLRFRLLVMWVAFWMACIIPFYLVWDFILYIKDYELGDPNAKRVWPVLWKRMKDGHAEG